MVWHGESLPKENESRCPELIPIVSVSYSPQLWQLGSPVVGKADGGGFHKKGPTSVAVS